MRHRTRAYSLIEIMIAVLFISIGFFGYVALHARILHSGQRLEEREVIREGTDFYEALEVGRITAGYSRSLAGLPHEPDSRLEDFYRISTDLDGKDTSWKLNYPEEYHAGLEETMEISPAMLSEPHKYQWDER